MERVWIYSEKMKKIHQTNRQGETLNSINVEPSWLVAGICVTREEELLVCCKGDQTIKKCTKDGSVVDVINLAPLRPICVCTSWTTGEIIVGAIDSHTSDDSMFKEGGRRVVIKYTRDGEKTVEIQFESVGKPMFTVPWKIQVNSNNGDIAVCNMTTANEGHVILLDKYGHLKFKYLGTKKNQVQNDSVKFCPVGLCFDSKSDLVISEAHSFSVQSIDDSGQYKATLYVNRRHPPSDVISCSNGDLMVGCSDGKVQILRYTV